MVTNTARFLRSLHRKEGGFTLIELLIVIAILAVLAAIAIPLVVNHIDKARVAADKANVAALQLAVDMYEFNREPGTDLTELTPDQANGAEGWIGVLVDAGFLQKGVKSPYGIGKYELTKPDGRDILVVESTMAGDKWTAVTP